MKSWPWIVAVVVGLALCVGLFTWVALDRRDDEPEWTSRSPAALEELEAGLDDFSKVFYSDAWTHLQKARKLEPNLFGANLFLYLMSFQGSEERAELYEAVRSHDPETLNARERFLQRYYSAYHQGDPSEMEEALVEFRAEHPRDAYGLEIECSTFEDEEQWEEARTCYRQLLELDPNRLLPRNNLGKIEMAEGRFEAAEEQFLAYHYVAPDLATPYTSLGRLMTLLGRYDEADRYLEEALERKDDYCEAHSSLINLLFLSGRPALAEAAIQRFEAVEPCSYYESFGFFCMARSLNAMFAGDDATARQLSSTCDQPLATNSVRHRYALADGRTDDALAVEAALAETLVETEGEPFEKADSIRSLLHYYRGLRALFAEDLETAIGDLREADRLSDFRSSRSGINKLFFQKHLAFALEQAGRQAEADEVRERIAAINPRVLDELPMPGLTRPIAPPSGPSGESAAEAALAADAARQ